MALDRHPFGHLITDILIFRDRHLPSTPNERDPILIWRVHWKMVVVHLDSHALDAKPIRNDVPPEVTTQE